MARKRKGYKCRNSTWRGDKSVFVISLFWAEENSSVHEVVSRWIVGFGWWCAILRIREMTQKKISASLLRGDPSSSIGECGINNEDSVGKNHYTLKWLTHPKKIQHFINSEFRNLLHNTTTPDPVLIYINIVHVVPVLKIYFNIIASFTPRSNTWPLSFVFPHQNSLCISPLLPQVVNIPLISSSLI
jgi:hypothetical protein